MKYLPPTDDEAYGSMPTVELTERNLRVLLAKLQDPTSARTVIDGDHHVAVRAVPNQKHYANRAPASMAHDEEFSNLERFMQEWAEQSGFVGGKDNSIRAWGGEKSEGYRVLAELKRRMEEHDADL